MNSESTIIGQAKIMDIQNNVKKKKITFISAIFIVIGSCIGSGIFFKAGSVLQQSWYSLPLAITTWIISAVAVICMSLSLIEVTSKKANNLSMIGWVKNFSSKTMYKACKNFMFYVYMPLTFFFMPIYVVQGFQDALTSFGLSNNFNTQHDWIFWSIISMFISLWFILSSGLSTRMGNIQNWIITCVKFLPLIIITILGFIIASENKTSVIITPQKPENFGLSFTSMSPGIGMFISFAAIFFAYDGFYYSVGIQTDMKEPEKTSLALVIGLVIVTSIYLLIAISISVAVPNSGSFSSFTDYLCSKNLGWLGGITNLFICIGVLGIINSFAMWSTRFCEDLIDLKELPFSNKFLNKTNPDKPIIGAIYVCVITFPLFIIFAAIGGMAYLPTYVDSNGNSFYDGAGYDSMSSLLGFADLMANWTSVFSFSYIVVAIIGCMKKRKSDNEIKKTKIFMPTAIITVLIVSAGLIFQTLAPFVDLILLHIPENQNLDTIVSRVMTVVVLLLYIVLMFLPNLFDEDSKFNKKRL